MFFGRVRFPGKVTAVVSMRPAGRTTFVHQLRREHIESGVSRERLPCLSFEDDRFADLEVTHLDLLISEYEREFPDTDDTATAIQVCADASVLSTAARKCRALAEAGQRFPSARRRLLTLTRDGFPAETPAGTEVQTACEWLLEDAP